MPEHRPLAMPMKSHLFYTFLTIFGVTAAITLLGILGKVKINEFYLKGLFSALLIALVGAVIGLFKETSFFATQGSAESDALTKSQSLSEWLQHTVKGTLLGLVFSPFMFVVTGFILAAVLAGLVGALIGLLANNAFMGFSIGFLIVLLGFVFGYPGAVAAADQPTPARKVAAGMVGGATSGFVTCLIICAASHVADKDTHLMVRFGTGMGGLLGIVGSSIRVDG